VKDLLNKLETFDDFKCTERLVC